MAPDLDPEDTKPVSSLYNVTRSTAPVRCSIEGAEGDVDATASIDGSISSRRMRLLIGAQAHAGPLDVPVPSLVPHLLPVQNCFITSRASVNFGTRSWRVMAPSGTSLR